MEILQGIGIGVAVLVCAALFLRLRRILVCRSGGIINMSVRVTTMLDGRGWSPGFGRFRGDQLRWYRTLSFAVRPKRVLSRHALTVQRRRHPQGQETLALPGDWIILSCHNGEVPVEIAMSTATLTGFLSWLEAAPPGAASPRLVATPQDRPAA